MENKCLIKKYLITFIKYLVIPLILAVIELFFSGYKNNIYIDILMIVTTSVTAGYTGFLLVEIVDYLRKSKFHFISFTKQSSFNSGGELINLNFEIKGSKSPGYSNIQINWDDKSVYAKWPETANPLEGDRFDKFLPNLVPQTFHLTLYPNKQYSVPLLHIKDNVITVFSGWWFAWNIGLPYGPIPIIKPTTTLRLSFNGSDLSWNKEYLVTEIIENNN